MSPPAPPASRPRPAVTVSMPAHNASAYIAGAIESVLAQDDVDFELVIVDDGSTDDTATIVASYRKDRVVLLRNDERLGIGCCHNRVIRTTGSPFIAHVDADDIILPGALAKLVKALWAHPDAGQAYCDFYPMDAEGRTRPEELEESASFFRTHREPPIDYARELVVHGMVVSALRTYRRKVFDVVGGFDENLSWAVDLDMALRIAEHFDFVRVPEMLYGRRVHAGGASQRFRGSPLRDWWIRAALVRRHLRRQGGTLFGVGRATTYARLMSGLVSAVRSSLATARQAPGR